MKIFIKNNKVRLIITIILLIWVSLCAIEYKANKIEQQKNYDEMVDKCKNEEEYQNQEWCNSYTEGRSIIPDTITVYFYIVCNSSINYIPWLAPMIIIMISIWNFHKKLHSGYIKNELMRTNYNDCMKKAIIDSLKCAFIFPFVFFFLFLISFMISGHFNIESLSQMFVNDVFLKNIPLLMITYFIVMFLHSIFYINLGLVSCKKNRNILVAILIGYLFFIIIAIISEIFIGAFFLRFLGLLKYAPVFNLLDIWLFSEYPSLISTLLYSILLVIFSFILLIKTYKDEEEVLISIEG